MLNAPIKACEYWVMRVLAPRYAVESWKQRAEPDKVAGLQARIDSGELCYCGGELCEPVEMFDNQEDATIRAAKEHKRTGNVHKVVLSAEL